jgi:hypothetical protein
VTSADCGLLKLVVGVNVEDSTVLARARSLTHSAAMTFLRFTLLFGFLLTVVACAESGAPSGSDDESTDEAGETDKSGDDDDDDSTSGGKRDASTSSGGKDSSTSSGGSKDAGKSEPKDGGSSAPKDSGASQTVDAGKATADAGGGFMFPDLFPTTDAGSGTKTDAAVGAPGDKSGPCKDLQLLCFDPIDMFIFNPSDCFTCNGGKGCQGCAIPFAY